MKKLIPHVYFSGNCLEAINHYLHVFKGEVEILDKYKDQPIEVAEEDQNKIYFCHFKFEGGEFYASDHLETSLNCKTHFWLEFDTEDEFCSIQKKLFSKNTEATKSVFGEQQIKAIDDFGIEWTLIRR